MRNNGSDHVTSSRAMDKNEKLAIARKKLKKFQAKNSPRGRITQAKKGGGGAPSTHVHHQAEVGLPSSSTTTTTSSTPTVPQPPQSHSSPETKNARLSSTEGLREISQEISSLLSESSLKPSSTPKMASSSSLSSLPGLAPPTQSSSSAAVPFLPPSLGTSSASSMSDLPLTSNHLNDSPAIIKSGSTSSLASSSYPVTTNVQSPYVRGHSMEYGLSIDNGYPQSTPSTITSGPLYQNGGSSILPSFGLKETETEGIISTSTAEVAVPRGAELSLSNRDTYKPSGDALIETMNSIDFQIGTPHRLSGSPNEEGQGQIPLHDGYGGAGSDRVVLPPPPLQVLLSEEERRELEQKIQAHAQTIDILVSEKSRLQTQLSQLQAQMDRRMSEWEEGQSCLKSTRHNLDELEHSKQLLNEELAHKQKSLSQSQVETERLRENVDKLRAMLEEQQEENTELISKITAQSTEISSVKNANVELQSKLAMAELLVQQLSGDSASQATPTTSDPALEEELTKIKGEAVQLKSRLQQMTSERDQTNSDLSALRDAMIQQQEENTSKLADAQTRIAESSAQINSLTEELQNLSREKETLSKRASTEHAQFEQSSKVAMETLQQERDDFQSQLQQRLKKNEQLLKENSDLGERSLELEVELSRLKEQTVDHQSLLTTIAQDKETLSRAMSQNKELKNNMAELQDAFVRISNQNMELASDLETERHLVAQLKRALAAGGQLSPPPPPPPASEVSGTESGSGQTMPTNVETTPMAPLDGVGSEGGGMSDLVGEAKEKEVSRLKEQEEQIESLLSERGHLLAQLQALEREHNQSLEEHRNVQEQLEELSQKHQQMIGETEEEEERRKKAKEQNEIDFLTMKEDSVDVSQMSSEQILQMQSNFRALQWKFISLMSEKAELLDRLQEQEHVIVQLSVETETIGEYISLYQTQREVLKAKFIEKDLFIEHLTNEKAVIQDKLHELQVLMRQLLSERAHVKTNGHGKVHSMRPTTLLTKAVFPLTPSPPHSPTDIPVHMRPGSTPQVSLCIDEHDISSTFSFTRLAAMDGDEEEEGRNVEETDNGGREYSEQDSFSYDLRRVTREQSLNEEEGTRKEDDQLMNTTATAEQILHLIGQLEMTTSGLDRHVAPCACCTGELTVV